MQIIIDIPEEQYIKICDEPCTELALAVRNGTPLPKGHGRLIDADEIQFENAEFDTYGDYSRAFDAIDEAETIIEADKERSDKE